MLSALVGLAPLLLYLYLPWRGHMGSLDGTYENTWAGFWRQVSAGGYGVFIFDNPLDQERDAAFYWESLQKPILYRDAGLYRPLLSILVDSENFYS